MAGPAPDGAESRLVLLADLVATHDRVGSTRGRLEKVGAIAQRLREAGNDLALAAHYLAGETPQERLDVGYRAVDDVVSDAADAPNLTLRDVDAAFERLARAAGPGSRTARLATLRDLLARATTDEQRFLRGLILGELRQGALAAVVVQGLAAAFELPEADVRRALMLAGDLGAVAVAAREHRLDDFSLTLFRPVLPMLAATADSVEQAIAELGDAVVEWKLDGARVQVHKQADTVRVYTRNLRDVTQRSPETVAAVRRLAASTAVLDGEVLAIGPDGRPAAHQDSMRADARRMPFFFDVLHVDGADLLDEPLSARLAVLERLVPAAHRVPTGGLDEALAAGHEGVMVKALDSPYEAGRRGAAWRKVKPVHTLDLVVLAAEWGSGRRRGYLSNIHLGARTGDGFAMVGKTFKGMTDEMLAWQTRRFLELETHRDAFTVYLRPEQVVEVALDGAQRSRRYPSGLSLRFARVKRYRDDKSPAEADTVERVRAFAPPVG